MPDFIEIPCIDSFKKKRARFLFRVRNEKARIEDEQLAATQSHGVLSQKRYVEITGNRVVETLTGTENFTHADQNDFVISLRTFEGGIEIAKEAGCISPAYTVLSPSREVYPPYFKHFFKSSVFISHLQTTITGIREGKTVKFENVANIILPIPDKSTQRKIADFLDRETARIDLLIEKKEQLLNLLIEQYLEPFDLHFRTSTKSRFEHVVSQVHRPIDEKKVETVVPIGLFNRGRGIFLKEETSVTDLGDSSFCFIKEGDLVLSGQFAWEGAVALVSKHEDGCAVSHRYPIFTPAKGINNAYLFAFFRTKHGQFILNDCSKGAAGRNRPLNVNLLKKWKIPIPDASEQSKIAALVQKEQIAKQLITTSISKLLEYKAALITAAVTGQIDVESASKSGTNEHHLDRLQKESEA